MDSTPSKTHDEKLRKTFLLEDFSVVMDSFLKKSRAEKKARKSILTKKSILGQKLAKKSTLTSILEVRSGDISLDGLNDDYITPLEDVSHAYLT